MIESIKTLLGAELSQKVEEALKGKGAEGADVDLVVGNDGTFVSAEKYTGANDRATLAENALTATAEAVKGLGGSGDPTKLGEDVTKVKADLATMTQGHKTELAKLQKNTALKMALTAIAHDPSDIIGLLGDTAIEIGEDGSLKSDLTELLKPIQTSKPYLFKQQQETTPPKLSGAVPAGASDKPPAKQYTSEELGKLSMDEYAAYRSQQEGFPAN